MRCLGTGRVNRFENAQETRNQGHHSTCPSANQVSYHVSLFSYTATTKEQSRAVIVPIFVNTVRAQITFMYPWSLFDQNVA